MSFFLNTAEIVTWETVCDVQHVAWWICTVCLCDWLTAESGTSKRLTPSREVTPSSVGSTQSSSHRVPSKSSTPHTTTAAGVVFYNSATAQMASSTAAQVLPVYLSNAGAINVVPVPLLQHCRYPVAAGSSPIMPSPCLAASAAGTQVGLLSRYQSIIVLIC